MRNKCFAKRYTRNGASRHPPRNLPQRIDTQVTLFNAGRREIRLIPPLGVQVWGWRTKAVRTKLCHAFGAKLAHRVVHKGDKTIAHAIKFSREVTFPTIDVQSMRAGTGRSDKALRLDA